MTVFSEIGVYSFADCLAIDRIVRAGLQRIECVCAELRRELPSELLGRWRDGDERAFWLLLAGLSVPELRRLLAIAQRSGERPDYGSSPTDEAATFERLKRFLQTQWLR